MTIDEVCKKLRKALPALLRKAFGLDLAAMLAARGQELWLLGIDSRNQCFVDICGIIDPTILAAIQARGFVDSIAGYKVDAQNVLPLQGKKVDIFLLNTDFFPAKPAQLEPLIVHELAHFLEEVGAAPPKEGNDSANAAAILKSLRPDLLTPNLRHNEGWALHLAAGGRRLIDKDLTTYKTIRAFLEAAIPQIDRHDSIHAKKGP